MPDWPDLLESVLRLFSVKLRLQDLVFDCVIAGGSDVGDCASGLGRQHDLVLDQVVLLYHSVAVAAAHVGANFDAVGVRKVPFGRDAECIRVNALGNVNAIGKVKY